MIRRDGKPAASASGTNCFARCMGRGSEGGGWWGMIQDDDCWKGIQFGPALSEEELAAVDSCLRGPLHDFVNFDHDFLSDVTEDEMRSALYAEAYWLRLKIDNLAESIKKRRHRYRLMLDWLKCWELVESMQENDGKIDAYGKPKTNFKRHMELHIEQRRDKGAEMR